MDDRSSYLCYCAPFTPSRQWDAVLRIQRWLLYRAVPEPGEFLRLDVILFIVCPLLLAFSIPNFFLINVLFCVFVSFFLALKKVLLDPPDQRSPHGAKRVLH